jgi:methylmalonyl-CoA/ethylmalonyl-CoA epimerase
MITRITHIGHVVRDLDQAIDLYTNRLGFKAASTRPVPLPGGRAVMIAVGNQSIELIEPTDSEHRVGQFLGRHGEGWFHVSMNCDDIDATVQAFRQNGIIVESPRFFTADQTGPRIAFVDPPSALGAVIELNERGPGR